jgi:hypothetical protein
MDRGNVAKVRADHDTGVGIRRTVEAPSRGEAQGPMHGAQGKTRRLVLVEKPLAAEEQVSVFRRTG